MAKPSKAQAKRIAAEARAKSAQIPVLDETFRTFLDNYVPEKVESESWRAVRATHAEVMTRANIKGLASFKKRCSELASFLAGRYERGLSIAISEALTYAAIDDDYQRPRSDLSDKSRNDRRSRLRTIAEAVNPSLDALPRAVPIGHVAVRPGYSRQEELVIKRVALRQRQPIARRRLCAVVGCCFGAGLDSSDLRDLRAKHIEDRGDDGIAIEVPGTRARRVIVRREYEEHLRVAIEGLRPNDLLIGNKAGRRNIVGPIVARAEILGDVPHIEASRMRSTWLVWLMTRPVPLQVILEAAGIKSSRSLIDLLPYVPDAGDSTAAMRDGDGQR